MNETAIYLYIFSGPHLGAKIALPLGSHSIGSDENADIQLYAQSSSIDFAIAPRHALISVTQDATNNIKVHIEAIDGVVYKEDQRNRQESFDLEASTIFYLSATCMLWNYPNVKQESVIPKITQQTTIPTDVVENNQLENEQDTDSAPLQNSLNFEEDSSIESKAKEEIPNKNKSLLKKIILPSLVAFLLLSLSVYFEPQNDNMAYEINYLTTKLAENNIDNIEIYQQTINGQNSILLEGYVQSEAEHKKIQDLARTLRFPVYLSLLVQEDILIATQNSFMLLGIYPYLEMQNSQLSVSAYIKNLLVEEAAFSEVKNEIANLPQMQRKIIHKEELSTLIDAKFYEKKLSPHETNYLDGSIHFKGNFAHADMIAIHAAMNEVIDSIGIPINYTIVHELSQKSQASNKDGSVFESVNSNSVNEPKQQDNASSNNESLNLAGLNISSVNAGAIPFITTQDGQRLFAGALLPNGFTIETINNAHIVLRKGSQVVSIDLEK